MKFKYKKMVLMITMGTMLIGFVIFSTVTPNRESASKNTKAEVEEPVTRSSEPEAKEDEEMPEGNGAIKKDLVKEVTQVVTDYLKASVSCDMEALEKTVNDISMIDEKELKLKYSYVESVDNIECYMVESPDKAGYLVYVYWELKLKDIKTPAPSFSRVYVTSVDAAGAETEYRVFFGAVTGLEEFIEQMDQSEEVQAFVKDVNNKMSEAQSKDADLDKFLRKIAVTAKPEETKEPEGTKEPEKADEKTE